MQGTMVLLMALSGVGCHHKNCCVAYTPPCYSASFLDGCYGGGFAGCYGGSYVIPSGQGG